MNVGKGLLIKLEGLIPSKKNSRITNRSTGRSFPSTKYRSWNNEARQQILQQARGRADGGYPRERCRMVRIHLWFGDLRRADLSNKAESVMDLLVETGILGDDNWRCVPRLVLSGRLRRGRPGALVKVL